MPGVFAAGDVRAGSVKRVASAVGEGALAVTLVHAHLATLARTRGLTRPVTRVELLTGSLSGGPG